MPLNIFVTAEEEKKEVKLDDITLMFFDTLMASLNAAFPNIKTFYDFFEYCDEDGDKVSVRSDDELQTFLVEVIRNFEENNKKLEIKLKSNNLIISQQLSIEEEDDGVLDSYLNNNQECCSLTLPEIVMEGNNGEKNKKILFDKQIRNSSPNTNIIFGPEDLQLIECLSEGQFGTVYKALDVKNDRLLAIKCLALDGGNGTRQGLLNEIAILKKSAHPNIVTFHAALFVENNLLICMELMDALSLDLYGQLHPLVLGACTVAIVEGLKHLWIVSLYIDIKPSNFLVNSFGEVKLADFGVSKQMAQSIAWSYVGTKVYMAPERINGNVYNVASDIWSLGISLAEMALGQFPFKNDLNKNIKSTESLIIKPEHISALLSEKQLIAIGNGFTEELLYGCLKLNSNQRFNGNAIISTKFLLAHQPMNKNIVADFINERRKNGLIQEQNTKS
uniref:mitogen-activated protein kinase kinase n=1 Tax=Meloidogyne enterolobii TaxID=390850 RepID=A0A6V7U8C9_MELEN|nr:unnamed protein product [Meloidogyne enterolobii]